MDSGIRVLDSGVFGSGTWSPDSIHQHYMVRNIQKALGKDITPPYVGHGFVNDLL